MTSRRFACAAISATILAAAFAAPIHVAAATFPEETPFNETAFETAQKAGEPILVHVTAPWCTTCAAQKPILDKLREEPRFKPLIVFNIDFDTQKPLVHKVGARMQSTLIVYKGASEVAYSSGETQPAAIEALLAKAF